MAVRRHIHSPLSPLLFMFRRALNQPIDKADRTDDKKEDELFHGV
jgi:hypothetical protein